MLLVRYLLLFILLPTILLSQEECYLGIGGKDDAIIAEVFQLTDLQLEQLESWSAELQYRNEFFEMKAENLLKNHPQSTPEDIMKMSFEYKILLDSMYNNVVRIDRRLINTFSDKQYNLYLQLCNQVMRNPIYALRSVNEK